MKEILKMYGYSSRDVLLYNQFQKNYEEESLDSLGIESTTEEK